MAQGMYSNGPRQRPVPLDKAKLWSNIGHLKNHLKACKAVIEYLPEEVECLDDVRDFINSI